MRAWTRWAIVALLLPWAGAEAQQASRLAKQESARGFSMETGDACFGLSREECCGQMLELAGFRAQGDYLPHLIKVTVQLACRDERKTVTPQVCRSIATSRGFAAKDIDGICKPAARECKKDGTCRKCVDDLNKLSYQGSPNACYAVTYMPERHPKLVVLRKSEGSADSDTRFEITTRRRELR